jgi:hypothetical protein
MARSRLIEHMQERPRRRLGRPPLPRGDLMAAIKTVITELPTYGRRRVNATTVVLVRFLSTMHARAASNKSAKVVNDVSRAATPRFTHYRNASTPYI